MTNPTPFYDFWMLYATRNAGMCLTQESIARAAFNAGAAPRAAVTVKDLVWVAGDGITASEEYLTADNGIGGYYWTMEGEVGCSFDLDAFEEATLESTEAEAKAAANAHHKAAVNAQIEEEI